MPPCRPQPIPSYALLATTCRLSLVLLFFDKDRTNKDDYLGFAALPLADLAKNGEFSCKDVSR